MPCSDHAVLLKVTAQHGRRETACGLTARVRLFPDTTRSSTKIVIGIIPVHPAFENGTDTGFRNVGQLQFDAGEIPRRKYTLFKSRAKV